MSGVAFDGKVLLLVNPTSGRGRSLRLLAKTTAAFQDAGFTPTVYLTESLPDATAHVRAAEPGSLVAVFGGDGFLGAAAAGAMESGAVLLPLAGGRGNDTVHRLGLGVNPVKTIASLPQLTVRDLDVGLVNGRPYFGVANAGYDGLSNEYGNAARLNLGPFVYMYGGIKAFFEWRDVTFTVSVDGAETTFPGWLVAVGNVGQYGGGLRIAPLAKVDDGLLDVVSLGRASIVAVLVMYLRSFKGAHLGQRNVTFTRGSTVRISANKPLSIYADGEMVGPLPAVLEVVPAAVKVLVPEGSPVLN